MFGCMTVDTQESDTYSERDIMSRVVVTSPGNFLDGLFHSFFRDGPFVVTWWSQSLHFERRSGRQYYLGRRRSSRVTGTLINRTLKCARTFKTTLEATQTRL